MARPIKNNADYFPHDANMRNDAKLKAVRRKFGLEGYAIYCMTVEYLTNCQHFKTSVQTLDLELMAGDFDIDSDRLLEVIQYCISLNLFQAENQILSCSRLENGLSRLLSKRERDRDRVIVTENTQSKEEKSKVKERKEEDSKVSGEFSGVDDTKFKDYEQWTDDAVKGNDPIFTVLLRNNQLAPAENLPAFGRSYLALLAEYPKKKPPDQHRFRLGFVNHIAEKINNTNGTNNSNKSGNQGNGTRKFSGKYEERLR